MLECLIFFYVGGLPEPPLDLPCNGSLKNLSLTRFQSNSTGIAVFIEYTISL